MRVPGKALQSQAALVCFHNMQRAISGLDGFWTFAVVVLADRREEIQGRARFPAIEVPWRFSSFNQATIRRDGANLEATYKRAPVLVLVAKSNAWITLRLLADMAVNLEAKRKSTALLLSQRCLQFVDYMLNKDMQKT